MSEIGTPNANKESAEEIVTSIRQVQNADGLVMILFGTDGDVRIIDDFPFEMLVTVEVRDGKRWTQYYALQGDDHPGKLEVRNAAGKWERSAEWIDPATGMTARANAMQSSVGFIPDPSFPRG
jgi:hypothetical protein